MTSHVSQHSQNLASMLLRLAQVFLLTALICLCAAPLASADELEAARLDQSERIKRLQDIAINTDGWYMNMAGMQSRISRSGLQTAGYSALQKDMLEVMRDLAENPNNRLALNRLEIIKDRVENRILANLDAGYLYATGVYIDMLQDIAPDSEKVILYRQQVADIKAFNELSRKFDQALAENRLSAPEDNCASYYLQQMRQLQFADADKIAEVEARLSASQQIAFNG